MQLIPPIQIATIRKTSTTNGILFVFTMLINLLTHQNHPKPFRKINVPDQNSLIKQRSDFFRKKASNSTTDFCYQKSHFRMLFCKTDKILYIGSILSTPPCIVGIAYVVPVNRHLVPIRLPIYDKPGEWHLHHEPLPNYYQIQKSHPASSPVSDCLLCAVYTYYSFCLSAASKYITLFR